MSSPDRPDVEALRIQSERLAPLRSQLLRRVEIAHRRLVLDLGSGPGTVTAGLRRRAGGRVVALDRCWRDARMANRPAVTARASCLPFADATFDLVFCQMSLVWMPLADVLAEVARVLVPGGRLAALEPDFAGLIEHPPEVALVEVWEEAVLRAGGDPRCGRRLPQALARAGFRNVVVAMNDRLQAPARDRFELIRGLPLSETERRRVDAAAAASRARPPGEVAHLPVMAVTAELA